MKVTTPVSEAAIAQWEQASNSLLRHVLGLSRYLQSNMMDRLQREYGHAELRLGFAPYITLIGERRVRPTELAEILGITRQACNQAIRQIERAGYVGHVPDPEDGRAKLLTLTEAGWRLRRDGVRVVGEFDRQFADIASGQDTAGAAATLRKLAQHLALGAAADTGTNQGYAGIGGLLPRISDYIIARLMELTRAKGHPELKLSFGQVIPLIGPDGGRIQQIAALQDVSKQAISVIAMELEELGYLKREPDPADARQIILRFTDLGLRLMTDASGSVLQLEDEFAGIAGDAAMANLAATLQTIFRGLNLDPDQFDQRETVDLNLLAQQLKQQLGDTRSQALGQLLVNSN